MRDTIESILGPVTGTYGVAARCLGLNETILINEEDVFPSASVIKVPILVELFCRRDEGGIALDELLCLRDEDKVDGSGVLKEIRAGACFSLLDLAKLMIVLSDNTATNMLIDRLGTDPVNERIRRLGLRQTVLARKMYDFEQAAVGKENVCSAADMMLLLTLMMEGSISSNSTSQEMLDIMARQQYREKIPLLLPDDVRVANKTGSISGVTHDVGVVYGAGGPYVLCVLTRGVSDKIAAERAIAEISRLIYEHFASRPTCERVRADG
jgi:beta-lactamase class A